MADIIWTGPALDDLDRIADYIAIDKPEAACRLVQVIVEKVGLSSHFPKMGRIPPELRRMSYRQIVIPPCRVFYRISSESVYIVGVLRQEQSYPI